jgi:hypothetical protein
MAGFITAEGLVIPIGSDAYDYVNDQRRLSSSIRSVVPVTNRAAGDTVAAAMNTDGRPVSDTNPLVVWNGASKTIEAKGTSGWVGMGGAKMYIGPGTAGRLTNYGTLQTSLNDGSILPIVQVGSIVITTDASGYFSITFPTPFPNGLISVQFTNGDSYTSGRDKKIDVAGSPFTQTLSTIYGGVTTGAGVAYASSTVRIEYTAWGW